MSERESELATALAALRDRLAAAALAAGRDVADVELLPITKFFPASDVAILWRLGCRSFGESREQEASAKIAEFQALTGATDVRWHMVGQIQRNKAKHIAVWADTVHSLSTAKVAAALDRGALQAIERRPAHRPGQRVRADQPGRRHRTRRGGRRLPRPSTPSAPRWPGRTGLAWSG